MTQDQAKDVVAMLVGPDDAHKLSLLYPEIQKRMKEEGTDAVEFTNLMDEVCDILASNDVHVVADAKRDIRVVHKGKEVIYDDESDSKEQ